MIKVYFESSKDGSTSSGSYAELVAIVATNEIYEAITPVLEEVARKYNMIVTESVEEEIDLETLV